MLVRLFVGWLGVLSVMACHVGGAWGQNYPNKSLRIVASEAGGPGDFHSRLISPGLSNALGQSVIVENRSSANIALETVAKAAPDGYTLVTNSNPMWYTPFMRKTSYDPVKDFSPITLMTSAPNVLVTDPALPVKSVKDIIALGKSRPGELNFATGSAGSAARLAAELLKAKSGIEITLVPYKGAGPAIAALISGRRDVQVYFSPAPSLGSNVKAGNLRAIAVTSEKPSSLFPDLPTVAETLPGFELVSVVALFGPANTPAPIVDRLNREVVRILNQPDVRQKLFNVGAEVVGSSPEQLLSTMKADMDVMGKVIKDAGIRDE